MMMLSILGLDNYARFRLNVKAILFFVKKYFFANKNKAGTIVDTMVRFSPITKDNILKLTTGTGQFRLFDINSILICR